MFISGYFIFQYFQAFSTDIVHNLFLSGENPSVFKFAKTKEVNARVDDRVALVVSLKHSVVPSWYVDWGAVEHYFAGSTVAGTIGKTSFNKASVCVVLSVVNC